MINVQVIDEQNCLRLSPDSIRAVAQSVIELENRKCDEVAIYLVSTATICELHQQHFNDPSPTDCISFPIEDEAGPYHMLGDVFVCPETAMTYATEHDKNPYEETTLYIVHGLLHLMGYDDIDPVDRKAMRTAERRHLSHLRKNDFLLKAVVP